MHPAEPLATPANRSPSWLSRAEWPAWRPGPTSRQWRKGGWRLNQFVLIQGSESSVAWWMQAGRPFRRRSRIQAWSPGARGAACPTWTQTGQGRGLGNPGSASKAPRRRWPRSPGAHSLQMLRQPRVPGRGRACGVPAWLLNWTLDLGGRSLQEQRDTAEASEAPCHCRPRCAGQAGPERAGGSRVPQLGTSEACPGPGRGARPVGVPGEDPGATAVHHAATPTHPQSWADP